MNLLVFHNSNGKAYYALEEVKYLNFSNEKQGRFHQLKSRVLNGYRRLRKRFSYKERMLGNLRHADRLSVFYAQGLDHKKVQRELDQLLQLGYRKHTMWLIIDTSLACLGSLLVWVPGPNIFFFYPAIRALGHYLARKGAIHTLQLIPSFSPEPLINQVEQLGCSRRKLEIDKLEKLEKLYSIDALGKFLKSEVYIQ